MPPINGPLGFYSLGFWRLLVFLTEILCCWCLLTSSHNECVIKTDVAHFHLPYVSASRNCRACVFKNAVTHLRALLNLILPIFYTLKRVYLLYLSSENIFHVLRSIWFYVLMKQKCIWNFSLCYFSLFCFYSYRLRCVQKLSRGRTVERKSDSTRRPWYKQTLRMYHSRWPISWLIPEKQYPVIFVYKVFK